MQQNIEGDQFLNPENFSSHYDYIIVGAGSAGSVIARRLTEDTEAKILVLEAGGSEAEIPGISDPLRWQENFGSAIDWNYAYQPTPLINNRTIQVPRGKVLGGSGSTNVMIWARGDRAVFDRWAAAGNTGWDYESVLPFFKKTETWDGPQDESRGTDGPMHIHQCTDLNMVSKAIIGAGQSYGMPYMDDTNTGKPMGTGPIQINIHEGKRDHPARAYLRPVLGHPNLTVLTGAQVQRLLFSGTRCTGISFIHQDQQHEAYTTQEVILTAGAIDTPRLLMLSGIGNAADLRKLDITVVADLPGVGQNLQDHPVIAGVSFEAHEDLAPYTNNLADGSLYWKSNPGLEIADLMMLATQGPFMSAEIQSKYPPVANTFSLLTALVQVKARGYIKLLSNQPNGPLEIQPNFLQEPEDVEAMLKGMELAFDLAEEPALKKLIKRWVAPEKRPDREGMLEFLRESCATYFHPVGTCAMGYHPEAVVNSKLLVHGIEGLRIADASVMPEITSANTQAPTMMIAEVAAQLILAGRKLL